jgi:predicted nucleic-acid-binding Zn-ribbon protein
MTEFKDIKEIPCWRCPQCGAEFFDSDQVEILDKHISKLINQQLDDSLDEEKKNENDEP